MRGKKMSFVFSVLVIIAGMLFSDLAGATTWHLSTDFSATSNSGIWTYGWGNTNYCTDRNILLFDSCATGLDFTGENMWRYDSDGYWYGNVLKNTGAFYEAPWGGVYEPGAVVFQAGGDTVSPLTPVTRWTSPVAQRIHIHVVFTGQTALYSGNYHHAYVYVFRNGVVQPLAAGYIDGFVGRSTNGFSDSSGPTPSLSYDLYETMNVGDKIDFAVVGGGSARIGVNASIITDPSNNTISVTADLGDFAGDLSLAPFRFALKHGSTLVQSITVTPTNTHPNAVFNPVPAGVYDVWVAGCKWLTTHASVTVSGGGTTSVSVVPINGDLDGDNYIGSSDYEIWSTNNDLTGDQ